MPQPRQYNIIDRAYSRIRELLLYSHPTRWNLFRTYLVSEHAYRQTSCCTNRQVQIREAHYQEGNQNFAYCGVKS